MAAVIVILAALIAFSQDREAELVARLNTAKGQERLHVLEALMDLNVSREPQKVLEYGERALPLFGKYPDVEAEAKLRLEMCSAAFRLGDLERAAVLADDGLKMARMIDHSGVESVATNMLGNIWATRGEYERALDFYLNTLTIKKEAGVQSGVASTLNNIAIVYRRMGDLDRALETYFQALRINEKLGRKRETGMALNNIAAVYNALGSTELALEYSLKALTIREEIGDKMGIAPTLNNIGRIQLQMGNYDDALSYLNRSLAIKRELGTKVGIASSLGAIGHAYLMMGDLETAQKNFQEALHIQETIGDRSGAIGIHRALGALYREWGRLSDARNHIEHALVLAEESNAKTELRDGYQDLAETQAAQEDYSGALASYKTFQRIHDDIINEETGINIGQLEARYEADQRAKEIALLKKDNQIQTLEIARQKLLRNVWVLGVVGAALLIGSAIFLQNRRTLQKRLEKKVEERTQELKEIQAQMVETAHRAGMAEIAIDVLHNVGNSLNSVHASAGMLLENLHNTKPLKILDGIVGLIEEQSEALGRFISKDERGKAIPQALVKINGGLRRKQEQLIDEVIQLKKGLNAVNDLIKAQDEHVDGFDRGETIDLEALVKNVLDERRDKFQQHQIRLIEEFSGVTPIFLHRYQLNRIIDHLLQNAIEAVTEQDQRDRQIIVKTEMRDAWVTLEVQDNGIGISETDLSRIFEYGFTTKNDAKGVGLHFSANAANAMGGRLRVESDGPNRGCRIALELPNTSLSA